MGFDQDLIASQRIVTAQSLGGTDALKIGAGLDAQQWQKIVEVCQQNKLILFLDMAYQGFNKSISEDNIAVRLFSESGLQYKLL